MILLTRLVFDVALIRAGHLPFDPHRLGPAESDSTARRNTQGLPLESAGVPIRFAGLHCPTSLARTWLRLRPVPWAAACLTHCFSQPYRAVPAIADIPTFYTRARSLSLGTASRSMPVGRRVSTGPTVDTHLQRSCPRWSPEAGSPLPVVTSDTLRSESVCSTTGASLQKPTAALSLLSKVFLGRQSTSIWL